MTDQPAAILATFSDWRPVKSRKVLQLVFEVPVEDTEKVLKALGTPLPHEEKWCGIALTKVKPKPDKPKRTWEELTPAEQSGIRCREPQFQNWIAHHPQYGGWLEGVTGERVMRVTVHGASCYVTRACDVTSKSELNTNPEAAARWRELDQRYMEETGRVAKRMG